MTNSRSSSGALVLAKGFGRGTESEEFRLVHPKTPRSQIGRALGQQTEWGNLLAPLYERTWEDLSRQYAVLVRQQEVAAFRVAPTEDRFGRASVVIVGLMVERWSLEEDARRVALAMTSIGDWLPSIAESVHLGDREAMESAVAGMAAFGDSDAPWDGPPLAELLSVTHCRGAATPLLLGLGADVVIGTAHEALDAQRRGVPAVGYLSSHTGRVEYFGDGREGPAVAVRPPSTRQLLNDIASQLGRIHERLVTLEEGQAQTWERLQRLEEGQAHLWEQLHRKADRWL